jgi:hypothetical protein
METSLVPASGVRGKCSEHFEVLTSLSLFLVLSPGSKVKQYGLNILIPPSGTAGNFTSIQRMEKRLIKNQ